MKTGMRCPASERATGATTRGVPEIIRVPCSISGPPTVSSQFRTGARDSGKGSPPACRERGSTRDAVTGHEASSEGWQGTYPVRHSIPARAKARITRSRFGPDGGSKIVSFNARASPETSVTMCQPSGESASANRRALQIQRFASSCTRPIWRCISAASRFAMVWGLGLAGRNPIKRSWRTSSAAVYRPEAAVDPELESAFQNAVCTIQWQRDTGSALVIFRCVHD